LKLYFKKFQFKSLDTQEFIEYFKYFVKENKGSKANELINSIDFNAWLKSPGPPPKVTKFTSDVVKKALDLADEFLKANLHNESLENVEKELIKFSIIQKSVFI